MGVTYAAVSEVSMTRSLPLILLFVVLTPAAAVADHLYLSVNDGSGGNFGFVGQMNGHPLALGGGTLFLNFFGYQPGSTLGGGDLYLSSSVIWVDDIPTEFFFPGTGSISMYPMVTMPTDGRDSFRAFVNISFSHTGVTFDDPQQTIDVGGGAFGSITFYRGFDGQYYPTNFVQAQVPEPGTLGLIGTGLMGIVGVVRKRLITRQPFRGR